MAYQAVFKRYELKYLLTPQQKRQVLLAMGQRMEPDSFGRSTIRNLYFDTGSYRLIRRSLEKPAYKEKLRVRSYHLAGPQEPVFVELKKKYDSVVYKRRLALPQDQAMDCLTNGKPLPGSSQIAREIDYFCQFYGDLRPAVFLSYEREAYFALDGSDFRVTFDENIRFRQDRLSLSQDPSGTDLLEPGTTLMEIKTSGSIPLWMTRCMAQAHIYKTSFSKYGTAYQTTLRQGAKGVMHYA